MAPLMWLLAIRETRVRLIRLGVGLIKVSRTSRLLTNSYTLSGLLTDTLAAVFFALQQAAESGRLKAMPHNISKINQMGKKTFKQAELLSCEMRGRQRNTNRMYDTTLKHYECSFVSSPPLTTPHRQSWSHMAQLLITLGNDSWKWNNVNYFLSPLCCEAEHCVQTFWDWSAEIHSANFPLLQ